MIAPIIALDTAETFSVVRRCLSAATPLRASSYAALDGVLEKAFGGILVADPCGMAPGALRRIGELCTRHGVRLLILTTLTPEASSQICDAASATAVDVVLRESEELPLLLRIAVTRTSASVQALVLHRIANVVRHLRQPLGVQTLALFCDAPIPPRAMDFATAVGVSEKTVLSWYAERGVTTTAAVLRIARVARALDVLPDGRGVSRIQRHVGFGSERTQRNAFAHVLSCAPKTAMKYEPYFAARMLASRIMRIGVTLPA